MNKLIAIVVMSVGALLISATDANAWGDTIWCKVNMGKIEACYPTFDQCNNAYGFGDCKPFQK